MKKTLLATLSLLLALPALAEGPKPKSFPTPKDAFDALVTAADTFDVAAIKEIFGAEGADLVLTDDAVQDRQQAAAFVARARAKHSLVTDPKNPKKVTVILGEEDWPAPIPIIKQGTGWAFDPVAGRREILYRRIGHNELDAIQVCLGYVEAQHEYAQSHHDGVAQYAQKIIATPGKQDGLAWQNPDGTWGGPVGEKIARVIAQGYADKSEPFRGYYFKVLKGQGAHAPMGEMDFVVKGVMIGGFALVAAPATYGVTGVKTFLVSHDGVVYEKDLGEATLDEFKRMQLFDPDSSWHPVQN